LSSEYVDLVEHGNIRGTDEAFPSASPSLTRGFLNEFNRGDWDGLLAKAVFQQEFDIPFKNGKIDRQWLKDFKRKLDDDLDETRCLSVEMPIDDIEKFIIYLYEYKAVV
jgi:hypothetical protein